MLWDERAGQWASLAAVHAAHDGAAQVQVMLQTCKVLEVGGATQEADKVRQALQASGRISAQSNPN
jgi:hypothetical protein